jgi:hypothetical protein
VESLYPLVDFAEWLGAFELAMREVGLCDKLTSSPLAPLSDVKEIAAVKSLSRRLLLDA